MKMWECVARRGLLGEGSIPSVSDNRVGVLVLEVDVDDGVKAEDGEEDDREAEMAKLAGGFRLGVWL